MISDSPSILTVTMNPALDVTTSVDHLTPREKLRCTEPTREPGGGGINVSRVIAELGGTSCAFIAAGGPTGEALTGLVRQSGVPVEVLTISGETRQSFMVYDRRGETQYRFVLPGPALSAAEWTGALQRLESLARDTAFVVGSGSLPPGTSEDVFWADLAVTASAAGARFILDTSGEALRRAAESSIHVLKLDEEEAADFLGSTPERLDDWTAAAGGLRDRVRAEQIVITLGAKGAIAVDAERTVQIPSIKVQPVSTVGAGDSFVAAMTLALERGDSLETACRFGVAAGAAAVMTPGSALAHRADVERLYASMTAS